MDPTSYRECSYQKRRTCDRGESWHRFYCSFILMRRIRTQSHRLWDIRRDWELELLVEAPGDVK